MIKRRDEIMETEDEMECPYQENGCADCQIGRDRIDCQDALREYQSETP